MTIDFKNNISAQIANMGLEMIIAQKLTDKSLETTEKVALFVATLFPWIIEAAVRYTTALLIDIVMSPATLILFPICAKLAEGDNGWKSCKAVANLFRDYFRFIHMVAGSLYSYEISYKPAKVTTNFICREAIVPSTHPWARRTWTSEAIDNYRDQKNHDHIFQPAFDPLIVTGKKKPLATPENNQQLIEATRSIESQDVVPRVSLRALDAAIDADKPLEVHLERLVLACNGDE